MIAPCSARMFRCSAEIWKHSEQQPPRGDARQTPQIWWSERLEASVRSDENNGGGVVDGGGGGLKLRVSTM